MSRYRLGHLQQRFEAAINQVEADVLAAERSGDRRAEVVTSERSVVFLQDSYGRFIRDLILRSSIGNATTASGFGLAAGPLGVLRQSSALDHLRHNWPARTVQRRGQRAGAPAVRTKPTWWEPDWYRQTEWTTALRLLGPHNGSTIAAALGSNASPADDIRKVRNFAVHRGPGSAGGIALVAGAYGVSEWRQPCDVITARQGASMMFEQWCARLRAVARAAVQ